MTKSQETYTRISEILAQLTPLYMQQADLYRTWDTQFPKPEALVQVQNEIAAIEAEHDKLQAS